MANNSPQPGKALPKDAMVIMSIFKDMGITDFDPQVVTQFLEFTYRYVTTTLEDAKIYAQHAGKSVMDSADVQLAVQMQLDKNFTTPPPRDLLMEVARSKNTTPLPGIKPHCGVRLPPDRYCMTACNFELRSSKKFQQSTMPKHNTIFSTTPQLKAVKRNIQTIRPQGVPIPKPVIKFTPQGVNAGATETWKTISIGNSSQIQTVMEIDEPPATLIKREQPMDE